MYLDAIRARRGAPWRLPSGPLTDSALSRPLLGIALALFGVALSGLLTRWTNGFSALAVLAPCIAIAASIGGVTSGLACLSVSALAFWLFAFFSETALSGMQESFLLIDGAVISGVSGVIASLRRRRTEEAIQRGESGLRLAVEIGGIGAFEFDPINDTAVLSEAARRIYGFSPDQSVTPDDLDRRVLQEDIAGRRRAIAEAMDVQGEGVYRTKYRLRRANDGAVRWISARGKSFYRNGRMTHIVGIVHDVTDEVDAERLLREKARLAERLTSLATTLPGAIFTLRVREDGVAYLPYAAPKVADVTGFGPEDLAVDMAVALKCVHIDDLMSVYVVIARAVYDSAPWRMRFRYHHPEKGLIWIEGEAAPKISGNGEVMWHGYLQDVTERQNAAAALETSEERLRAVFDGADDAIFTVDPDGNITSLNAAGRRMFGYPAEDIVGAHVESLMRAESGFWRDATVRTCLKREIQGRRKDGSLFPVYVTFSEIRTGEGDVFVGFARDLTEQHRIEARIRLLNDERQAALETMASGLAHEVNQPLSASATSLKVARQMLEAPHDDGTSPSVHQVLEKAAAQIMRAGRIMTRVREFSTRGEPDKTFQNLHELLTSVTRALGEDSRFSGFRLELSLEAANDLVIVDRQQISQVLVNLLHNAVQAMQDVPARDIVVTTVSEGPSEIRVQIIDYGVGMSEETRKNLFEPFKTIKPSGMGIGLSVSRGIVESHFGKIWAEPNACGGAIFNFTLPLVEQGSS
jgi:PAS domain S-box-containing protein